jgi:hypothetical protein
MMAELLGILSNGSPKLTDSRLDRRSAKPRITFMCFGAMTDQVPLKFGIAEGPFSTNADTKSDSHTDACS